MHAGSEAAASVDLDAGLARLGFAGFRPGQREAMAVLLDAGKLLLVAPTGGGKSLTYQLPASLLPGTTLVISPLVSLMADQVRALDEMGVAATFLAATLDADERHRRMDDMARGRFDLVYAAPERLGLPGFRSLLRDLDCPLVAVDEAHCISEWGHDFRPEYLQIGDVLADLPGARVLACTATATPVVRDEILERLRLDAATPQLIYGFARPNLSLRAGEVEGRRERDARVDAALAEALDAPGAARGAAIVYAPTRKATEQEARRLAAAGWRAAGYHAGMGGAARTAVQAAFAAGATEIVVATNAFGMGIDRADVRAVIHLAPPGSLEAYYQEVGRAGRDGDDALGLLLISPGDLARRRALIEGDGAEPEITRHKWTLFLELMRYAEGGSCRHDAILRYFGDEAETLDGCGRCDVCASLESAPPGDGDAEADIVVRKALSAVARIHGRFGLGAASALLRGADDPRVRGAGLERTPTFGALADRSESWLQKLLRRCVTAGWVDFEGDERPIAVLTTAGSAVMRGERPARLLLPPRVRLPAAATSLGARRGRPARPAPDPQALDGRAQSLFEALRRHRLALARARGVPPYVIASDRSLREIALMRPRDRGQLEQVYGIGPAKATKYGAGLLAVVADAGSG